MDMRGNSQMDMRGFVWIGQRFLSHDKWQVKLLSDFSYFTFTNDSNSRNNNKWKIKLLSQFSPICIQPFTNDSNSRNNKLIGFGKFTNGYEGLCMSEGKFPKPWQVTDKIIEWFILQFISYILWMTQTQEKITCRVLKIHKWIWREIHKWIWGDVYELGQDS